MGKTREVDQATDVVLSKRLPEDLILALDQDISHLRREDGLWVFRGGGPVAAAETDRVLCKSRAHRSGGQEPSQSE